MSWGRAAASFRSFANSSSAASDHLPITDPQDDPLLDHARKGRRVRLFLHGHDDGRRDLRAENSQHEAHRSGERSRADLEQRVVGIRPGEKLHEVMITEDDARNTRDLGDRYVIEPSILLSYSSVRARRGTPGGGRLPLCQRHQRQLAYAGPALRPGEGLCGVNSGRKFLPYGRQSIDDDDIAAVVDVLRGR